jgi:acyl dehydratase
VDPVFAASESRFGATIVHGILVSSLFSTLFGRTIPGCIYLKQSLDFRKPIYVGSKVLARVEVTEVVARKKGGDTLVCSTRVYVGTEVSTAALAIDGSASVLLPKGD